MLVYPQEKIRDDIIHLVNRPRERGSLRKYIIVILAHETDIRRRNFHLFYRNHYFYVFAYDTRPRRKIAEKHELMKIFSNFFFVKHIRRVRCSATTAATDDKYVEGDINDAAGVFFTCVREI